MIQKRNIAMYIILSIVTCGIFGIYWFICLTDDSKLAANVMRVLWSGSVLV